MNILFWPADQRKGLLKVMEERDDLDTEIAKLVHQASKYNIQRFRNAMEIKVINLYSFAGL